MIKSWGWIEAIFGANVLLRRTRFDLRLHFAIERALREAEIEIPLRRASEAAAWRPDVEMNAADLS